MLHPHPCRDEFCTQLSPPIPNLTAFSSDENFQPDERSAFHVSPCQTPRTAAWASVCVSFQTSDPLERKFSQDNRPYNVCDTAQKFREASSSLSGPSPLQPETTSAVHPHTGNTAILPATLYAQQTIRVRCSLGHGELAVLTKSRQVRVSRTLMIPWALAEASIAWAPDNRGRS